MTRHVLPTYSQLGILLRPTSSLFAGAHPSTTPHPRFVTSSSVDQTISQPQVSRHREQDRHARTNETTQNRPELTHIDPSTGAAHMVDVAHKQVTSRAASAACTIYFSNDTAPRLIRENNIKKGDVLGTARIAGIMAAKRTADLIPLCHPLMLSHISVDLAPVFGFDAPQDVDAGVGDDATRKNRIDITARVCCDGKTGVEMEALTAASVTALTVYDMCKAVDKGMHIEALRLIAKVGGKSGNWGQAYEPKTSSEARAQEALETID